MMNAPHGWFGRLWRGLLGLLMALAGLVFLVSLMLAGLVAVALLSLWALLTGRKPAPVVVFQRFLQASTRFGPTGWSGPGRPTAGDVVDVQAHEVPDEGVPRVTSPDHGRK